VVHYKFVVVDPWQKEHYQECLLNDMGLVDKIVLPDDLPSGEPLEVPPTKELVHVSTAGGEVQPGGGSPPPLRELSLSVSMPRSTSRLASSSCSWRTSPSTTTPLLPFLLLEY
jgi:hypothetical protein